MMARVRMEDVERQIERFVSLIGQYQALLMQIKYATVQDFRDCFGEEGFTNFLQDINTLIERCTLIRNRGHSLEDAFDEFFHPYFLPHANPSLHHALQGAVQLAPTLDFQHVKLNSLLDYPIEHVTCTEHALLEGLYNQIESARAVLHRLIQMRNAIAHSLASLNHYISIGVVPG